MRCSSRIKNAEHLFVRYIYLQHKIRHNLNKGIPSPTVERKPDFFIRFLLKLFEQFMKILLFLFMVFVPSLAFANGTSTIQSGDTAWMLIATGLVMMMTPAGLALFYGGMTRSKNALNTVGMSYAAYCIGSLVWVLWGYSLAFGTDINGVIGSLNHAFLHGIAVDSVTGKIPTLLYISFQGMFAAIAVAIVSGSVVERIKFSTWMVFTAFWVTFVYAPTAHWVWGGGFLSTSGNLDFAGGTVIHISAGISGLVLALMLGKRKDYGVSENNAPSSTKLTVLGSALLWFGWFGFNGGSALEANGLAASAILVTNIAASIGALGWMLTEWLLNKRTTMLGAASGAIAGLVGITPAAGYVDLSGALIIGLLAGMIGYFGVFEIKTRFGYDDPLDAFGIHALAGIWGAIATGIFANPAINSTGVGAFFGNPKQILTQAIAVVVTIAFSSIGTFFVFKISSLLTGGARVDSSKELTGLDETIHGERSFNISI